MKPGKQPSTAEQSPDARDTARDKTTPSTDMQPEDTGTSESGATGLGTATEDAMKQTDKTGAESGGNR